MKDPDIRHALKNRLTVMKCNLELILLDGKMTPSFKKALKTIENEVDKMVEILSPDKKIKKK